MVGEVVLFQGDRYVVQAILRGGNAIRIKNKEGQEKIVLTLEVTPIARSR